MLILPPEEESKIGSKEPENRQKLNLLTVSTISVIVCVYNGENYLQEAIESILKQEYPHLEILVVDDGSTDGTPDVIRSFGQKIRSIHQPHLGLGSGRNRGVRAASGEYLSFLDHDDLWAPNKLRVQTSALTQEDTILFSSVQQFICPSLSAEEKRKLIVDASLLPGYLAGTMLISKRKFLEVGYFNEKTEVGEFVDWFIRAKEANLPMKLLPEVALFRRIHRNNMGRRPDLYDPKDYLRILKASLDRKRVENRPK